MTTDTSGSVGTPNRFAPLLAKAAGRAEGRAEGKIWARDRKYREYPDDETVVVSQRDLRKPVDPPAFPGYRFIRSLSSGSLAEVFLFEHRESASLSAFKVYNDPEIILPVFAHLELLRKVTQSSARLAELRRWGVTIGGHIFHEFAFVGGKDGWSVLKNHRRLTDSAAIRAMTDLVDGVHALHAAGLTHGDIRPSNALLGGDGRWVLMDYDFLGAPDDVKAGPAATSGPWAAPELSEESQGPRSAAADIYALGATLFTFAVGRDQSDDSALEIQKRRTGDYTVPEHSSPSAPFKELVDATLRSDPDARPSSLRDLLVGHDALESGVAGSSTQTSLRPAGLLDDLLIVARATESEFSSDEKRRALIRKGEDLLVSLSPGQTEAWEGTVRHALAHAYAYDRDPARAVLHAEAWKEWARTTRAASDDDFADIDLTIGLAWWKRDRWADAVEPLNLAHRYSTLNGFSPRRTETVLDFLLGRTEHALSRVAQFVNGNFAEAEERARRAYDLLRRVRLDGSQVPTSRERLQWFISDSSRLQGIALRELGRFDSAIDSFRRSQQLAPDEIFAAKIEVSVGMTQSRMVGRSGEARRSFESAAATFRSKRQVALVAWSLRELAEHELRSGSLRSSRVHFGQAHGLYLGINEKSQEVAFALVGFADASVQLGEDEVSRQVLGLASAAFTPTDAVDPFDFLELLTLEARRESVLAKLEVRAGRLPEGDDAYSRAASAFARAGKTADAADIERRRAEMYAMAANYRAGDEASDLRQKAATVMIPAAIAIDAVRFDFRDSHDRSAWSVDVAARIRSGAFQLASESGDQSLLADMILDARSNGILTMNADSELADAAADVAEAIVGKDTASQVLATYASGVLHLLGREGLRLDPAPRVRNAKGQVALEEQIRTAERRFGRPVRHALTVPITDPDPA